MSRKSEGLGRVGSYRLLSMVEERDLLATYVAEHEELGRRALIRTVAENITSSPRLEQALEREARIVSKLSHPAIVVLYEMLRVDRRPALALEYPGATLREACDALALRGGFSTEEAVVVVIALVRAVAHVHQHGFVHANISTKTIYLAPERGVVLAGFDRARDSASGDEAPRAGLDPTYLSPEELMDEPPTSASDVFAIGVVAYELLAGERPFGPRDDDASTSTEAGAAQATSGGRRVRIDRPNPIDRSRRVPVDVERAVLRALSKQPGLRQANAGELLQDLEAAVGSDLVVSKATDALTSRVGLGGKTKTSAKQIDTSLRAPEPANERRSIDVALRLGAVFLAMVALVVAIEVAERSSRPASSAISAASAPGYVRVLAHPWAEIWVDGVATDTTPMAKPIELSAGRHTIVFKHPRASDERRVVDLGSGEVVTVAVDMRVVAPPIDAGVDASP